ncbi:hypothetical protein KUTeg_002696 [Tegillarca granosa]|uniref:Uncharacterized protein n=1 Tax=Tegillarca granosa TaxID=220873 RepID=A0ABQ9FV26_TEGGR|nr:hypothetical protein KUTeg_002696 [Tegillarca granosa]
MEDRNHVDFGNFTLYPPDLWEMNSSDDEFLQHTNSSIECDTQKLDECLKQPALDIPPPELPATVSTSEPLQKRFKTVSKQEQERLFEARQAPTTKKNTLWGMKIFQALIEERDIQVATDLLESLGGWPMLGNSSGGKWKEDTFDMSELLIGLMFFYNSPLIDTWVSTDMKNSTVNTIYVRIF